MRILILLLMLTSCSTPSAKPSPEQKPTAICFDGDAAPDPPQKRSDGEGPFTAELLGRDVTLGGQLQDTSAINLFMVNRYDGFRIRSNRLYVKDRTYINPFGSIWCTANAKISRVDPQ